ncbi:MAG: UbiA family prenyltransferase, partial [Fibrobacterota bacterium]
MKTLDYIFLARPVLLGPVWTIFLLGAFHASPPGYLPSEVAQNINIIRFAAVFITFSLLVSSIYVFNQIMDLDSDRHNKKLFILADGIVSESSAIKYALLLTFIPLITAPFMGHRMLTVYAASALTGVLYNFRPFLFKNRPVSGLLSNMAGHGFLVFFAGYLTIRPEASFMKMAEQALPYALAVGSVFLCTTIPDIKGDERYGKIT